MLAQTFGCQSSMQSLKLVPCANGPAGRPLRTAPVSRPHRKLRVANTDVVASPTAGGGSSTPSLWNYGYSLAQGPRDTMEDRVLLIEHALGSCFLAGGCMCQVFGTHALVVEKGWTVETTSIDLTVCT
jgi:hypothetical protein